MTLGAGLVMIIGAGIFLYPHVASWFSQLAQSKVIDSELVIFHENTDQEEAIREELAAAHEYNEALSSGAIYEANANIALGSGSLAPGAMGYNELLNETGSGFMGRLLYEDLGIDLPIYHGTSDDILLTGVGHLEGTSLPVGRKGTRSVLTAHRGLPESTLFNNLDKAEVGDIFSVTVLDEVYAYQVFEIKVINPEDTQQILPDPDRDLMTLVTCTPLGINTHRILVTAERIYPTPEATEAAALATPQLPHFPWWTVIIAVIVIGIGVYVWRDGYRLARIAQVESSDDTGESTGSE